MRIITSISLAILTIGSLYAQEIKPKQTVAEEVVAIVGNEAISMSELYQKTQQIVEYRRTKGVESKVLPAEEALETLLQQKLLATCAKLDSLDKIMNPVDIDVQERVDAMIQSAGSIKALETKYGKPIFQIRESIKRDITESTLAMIKEHDIRAKVTITHNEVETFFKSINVDTLPPVPTQIRYSQIVKMPPATEERKFEVRQRLLEFRDRILKGEKLSILARLYTQDISSRSNGGLYSAKYDETTAPYSNAVRLLKPGQISEIVETEFGYHIIELISRTDNDFVTRHLLLKPEFTEAEEIRAKTELDSISTLIHEGKITFAMAAMRSSDDILTKMNGGINFNLSDFNQTGDIRHASTLFVLDQVNPFDARAMSKLQVGEISAPFQNMDSKGNIVFKIVSLTSIIPQHKYNMTDDFSLIESSALNEKQAKTVDNWIDQNISKIYIYINPEYMHYNLEREGWKNQSQKNAKK